MTMLERKSERVRRWARAQTPTQDPPFTRWHGVALLIVLLLFLSYQLASGVVADTAGVAPLSYVAGTRVWQTTLILTCIALFVVRSMPPVMYVVLGGQVLLACMHLGELRMVQAPQALPDLLTALLACLVSVRVILRPNDNDTILALRRRAEAAEAALAEREAPHDPDHP